MVKEFHPDREQNEDEKVRKNSIMHQITEAYEQNDLFRLLQLKLELQATSPDALNLADEQLKYYNKVLKEQVDELQGELYQMKGGGGGFGFGMSFYQRLGGNEKTMNMKFAAEINKLKRNIKDYDHDLKLLTDRYHMRDFLKQIKIQQEPDFFDLFGM